MIKLDGNDLLWSPYIFFEDFGLRPSQYMLIREMDYQNKFGNPIEGKGKALDMIMKSEAWLAEYGIEKDTIDIINERLKIYGIRIGMSEQDLFRCLDEYHAGKRKESEGKEETSRSDEYSSTITFSLDSAVPELDMRREAAIVSDEDSRFRKSMNDGVLNSLPNHFQNVLDCEFLRVRFLNLFLSCQPWHVRLFRSRSYRMALARRETDEYMEKIVERQTEYLARLHRDVFVQRLKRDWKTDWKNYMDRIESE